MTSAMDERPTVPPGRYRFTSITRSEWTKLWSVRSTTWTLLATAVVTLALSVLGTYQASSSWSSASAATRVAFDPTSQSLQGVIYSQLVIGVLGVLIVSSEFATGTIRVTLAAAPSRTRVLAAKVAVFAVVSAVVGEALSFLGFFLGQALLRAPAPHASIGQPGVLRAVAGSGLILTVLGVFALGLASIIRHTAGAITAYVIALLVLPLAIGALPMATQNAVDKFLPAHIGFTMTSTLQVIDHPAFPPWGVWQYLRAMRWRRWPWGLSPLATGTSELGHQRGFAARCTMRPDECEAVTESRAADSVVCANAGRFALGTCRRGGASHEDSSGRRQRARPGRHRRRQHRLEDVRPPGGHRGIRRSRRDRARPGRLPVRWANGEVLALYWSVGRGTSWIGRTGWGGAGR